MTNKIVYVINCLKCRNTFGDVKKSCGKDKDFNGVDRKWKCVENGAKSAKLTFFKVKKENWQI